MKIAPPMKPIVASDDDYSNFDKEFINEEVHDTPAEPISKNGHYAGFSYMPKQLH
jgi:hypothetical protein